VTLDAAALPAVTAWMDSHGLGSGPLVDVRPLTGGTQNVMARFERAGRCYVLRRGPEHLRPRSNDVIRRECRVLEALADTPVPHARLIAAGDEAVLDGAFFYLMEPVEGFNANIELPALHAGDAGVRRAMGLSMVDALADLHAVDHVAAGLGDFGRPAGGPPAHRLSPGHPARRLPRRQRDVLPHRAGGRGHRRLGDEHGR